MNRSIDELIDDTKNISDKQSKKEEMTNGSILECEGKYYDIDLKGWNDGVFNVFIIGEDKDFLFYKKPVKDKSIFGLIGKRYITEVKTSKTSHFIQNDTDKIDKTYFCGKHVFIDLACKEGFIIGFLDFRNDDYLDVIIRSFSKSKVQLEFGGEIEISCIAKIEQLSY